MQHLNHTGHEFKKIAVYVFNTHVTLKQGESHQIWYDYVDSKQGSNHAKFERSSFNSVREKANVKFWSVEEIYRLFLLNTCES